MLQLKKSSKIDTPPYKIAANLATDHSIDLRFYSKHISTDLLLFFRVQAWFILVNIP